MTATFKPFLRGMPGRADSENVRIDAVRNNLAALVASIVTGSIVPGWSYTNSVTLAEASPGTADKPARAYLTYGSGATKIWVKAVLTWDGSSNITKIALYWSDDNSQSYDTLRDTDGNYVLTIAYDGSSNVTSGTWGQVP